MQVGGLSGATAYAQQVQSTQAANGAREVEAGAANQQAAFKQIEAAPKTGSAPLETSGSVGTRVNEYA